ncbi:hypothetical protein ACQP2T_16215 [Nonomuraea sp. CA-143628]|uniref:hypothetical protein n=1 Tax=Nonomuraea sp. CA-143628 TaxID=3239997 RepID=UPI003D8D22F5
MMNPGIDLNSTDAIELAGREVEMDLTYPDVESAHRVAAIRTWLELDLRDRQLAVLRLNFPQWVISYQFAQPGSTWRAVPTWQLTVEQVAAGVLRQLERGNPIALMADLSTQMWIIRDMPRTRP